MERGSLPPVPPPVVADSITTALALVYGAPTPGTGSRYADADAAHEARVLSAPVVSEALATGGVGESVLGAALSSRSLTGFADPRAAGYLAPLARSRLLGVPLQAVLSRLGAEEVPRFIRAVETASGDGASYVALREALGVALTAGGDTTLRDAMRLAAKRDPLARDYARGFEVPRELARPAILASLSRANLTRPALVQAYLETLSEVPDLDVAARAGLREAEDISRMARGVLKAGGVHSRRGLEGITNLDGLLREDRRLSPTATEPVVIAAAFMVCIEHGPEALGRRLRPASPGNRGR